MFIRKSGKKLGSVLVDKAGTEPKRPRTQAPAKKSAPAKKAAPASVGARPSEPKSEKPEPVKAAPAAPVKEAGGGD